MLCDELARIWPEKCPRPDAENTKHNGRMVRGFGSDFAGRDPASIGREEALDWGLANLMTVRYVRTMFNDLIRLGVLDENPWAGLPLPKPGSDPVVVPTERQIDSLVLRARETGKIPLATRIEFAAAVGLRTSEQAAVVRPGAPEAAPGNRFPGEKGYAAEWLTEPLNRLRIDWQKGRDGKLKKPKTRRGHRTVLVPASARSAVVEALEHHDGKSEFLWPQNRDTFRRQWSTLRRETGIWFKWHNLRHYCATWMLDHGATVDDVAVQLGIRPEEVRKTYGHPDEELALQRLENLVEA